MLMEGNNIRDKLLYQCAGSISNRFRTRINYMLFSLWMYGPIILWPNINEKQSVSKCSLLDLMSAEALEENIKLLITVVHHFFVCFSVV